MKQAREYMYQDKESKVLSGESCWRIQGTPKGQVCLKRTGEQSEMVLERSSEQDPK